MFVQISSKFGGNAGNPLKAVDAYLTIPAGEYWRVTGIHVKLITTATVGNRRLAVNVADAYLGNLIRAISWGTITIPASTTAKLDARASGLAVPTSYAYTNFTEIVTPFAPDATYPPGATFVFNDDAAVDTANDTIELTVFADVYGFVSGAVQIEAVNPIRVQAV